MYIYLLCFSFLSYFIVATLSRKQQLMVAAHALGGMTHPYLEKRIEFRRTIEFTDMCIT